MPAVTRELSITYAGVTLGGTSDNYLLFGTYTLWGSETEIGFRGRVMCRSSSESDFASKRASLEAAFQTRDGTLVVTQGSATMRTFGATANTGFHGRPTWRKVGGPEDSGRACLYEVSVTATRPADHSGGNGLRVARIELITKFFGAREYRVSGTYTALSSNTARQQYNASVGSFLTSLETDLTGSWARMDATVTWDDRNKLAEFSQVAYEEGLRDAEYSLEMTLNGLRSYRVTGQVAADGSTDTAAALYTANLDTWLDAFETALTGTWMRGAARWRRDGANKMLVFEQEAVEVGARDVRYATETDPSGIRSYVVSGFYTANGGTGALASFNAGIGALLSAFETLLTGTFESEVTATDVDQADKTCRFEVRGRELIANQSQGVLDNTSIKAQRIAVFRSKRAPGDLPDATRPAEVTVAYEASIAKTVALAAFYESTIRPFLIEHARTVAGAIAMALIEERPGLDIAASRISASLTFNAFDAAILQHGMVQEDDETSGVELVPVWSKDPDEWEEMDGRAVKLRKFTEAIVTLGALPPSPVQSAGANAKGYRLLRTVVTFEERRQGSLDVGATILMAQRVHILQYRNPSQRKGGGAGSSSARRDGRIETPGGTGGLA